MKLTLQLRLLPDTQQAALLQATVERFNEAADWLAGLAFQRKLTNKYLLQKIAYAELRNRFELPADTAIRCIAQVVEASKRDQTKRPHFKKHASVPFSLGKNISFKGPDRVSISTLRGRVIVSYIMGKYQAQRFGWARGQCDLVRRKDGKWFLLTTVDVPDGTPLPTTDFIGVDLGVVNLATTDQGEHFSGEQVETVRQKYHACRQSLQKKAARLKKKGQRPKQVRRKLQKTGGKESRFRRDVNHQISKKLVAQAKDTGRGIALADLRGIRSRTRFRKPQRARMAGWAFWQLRAFIEYKAKLSGVPVRLVDPAYTSQTCSRCGHCEGANRPSQDSFCCHRCGYTLHADVNAARIIRARALVNAPQVSETSCRGVESRDKLPPLGGSS